MSFLWPYIDFWNISEGKISYILNLARYDVDKYNMSTVEHNYKRSKQMTKTTKQNATCTLQFSNAKQKPTKEEFKTSIAKTVDESLASFCNLDKEAVYLRLENTYHIKRQEIDSKIENFADAIEHMFGVGAKLVEIRIIAALHKRIPEFIFFPKKSEVDFKEYVISLRSFMLQSL
jgi:hypothetical protein